MSKQGSLYKVWDVQVLKRGYDRCDEAKVRFVKKRNRFSMLSHSLCFGPEITRKSRGTGTAASVEAKMESQTCAGNNQVTINIAVHTFIAYCCT